MSGKVLTVRDLIEVLQGLPADTPVYRYDGEWGELPVEEVEVKQSFEERLVRQDEFTTVIETFPIVLIS